MSVMDIPNSVIVDGMPIRGDLFPAVVKEGTNFDEYKLNKDTDIIIATYSRTGTTWVSHIVSLLMAEEDELDEVNKTMLTNRVIFVDIAHDNRKPDIEKFKDMPAPRIAKTHLPYRFVNRWVERDGVKTIVTIRNPKDTLVSYYNFYRSNPVFGPFEGNWTDFITHVQAGKLMYGDQFDYMEGWWEQRHRDNILFVRYEDMLQDLTKEMKRIIQFLELDVTDKMLKRVCEMAKFDEMKKNTSVNGRHRVPNHIRSGGMGEWKDYFTAAQNGWFDDKYKGRVEGSAFEQYFD